MADFHFNDRLTDAVGNNDRELANELERQPEVYFNQNPGYEVIRATSNGTFEKANYPWAKLFVVTVVGGGGGSGGCDATGASQRNESAGGGGGGASVKKFTPADLAASESYTVGAGGAAGAAGANAGGQGGTTSFGSHHSATGGFGGAGMAAVSTVGASSRGYRGVGTGGDMNLAGSAGGNGTAWQTPTSLRQGMNAWGGDSALGFGGQVTTAAGLSAAGVAGELYGGGASGCRNTVSASARAGAAGAAGIIIIEIFG